MKPNCNQEEDIMPTTITVKNIPQDLYNKLKNRALRNHRSVNREIISIFEKTLTARHFDKEDILISARALREKTSKFYMTQDFIKKAKEEGRR